MSTFSGDTEDPTEETTTDVHQSRAAIQRSAARPEMVGYKVLNTKVVLCGFVLLGPDDCLSEAGVRSTTLSTIIFGDPVDPVNSHLW